MSAKEFLNFDIKKLFEQHTIKDIELIQKQIQSESDRKKIELRTLVGERYRDLIQAADSIAKMKEISESIIARIVNIEKIFHELQQKYFVGFNMETETLCIKSESSSILDSVVIMIRILMDIPEQIWLSIEEKNFLLASQLFLMAQHMNYSLKFEVGDSILSDTYPIVFKQWNSIEHFRTLIINFCNDTLQFTELSKELAANCLGALVLLDGLDSSNLLNRLISLRSHTIQSIIISESDRSIKDNIKLCLSILIKTIPLITNCFIKCEDNDEGLVSKYINDIKDKDAFSMLSKFDLNEELTNKFLPSVAKNHKPFLQYELKKLPLDSIQNRVNEWFQWVEQLASTAIFKLLNLITSIKGIFNVREECLAVCIPDNWDLIWEILSLPKFNFWYKFFQPLLTERIKGILKDNLNSCLNDFKEDIIEFLNKIIHNTSEYSENDLRWFVWKECLTDISQKLMKDSIFNNNRPLLMKARGFSPNLLKLCENFDENLAKMILHLKLYLYEIEQITPLKDDLLTSNIYITSSKFSDYIEIQEYLQIISKTLIDDFLIFVKDNCIIPNPKIGKQDINTIVIARLLQALPILCPNLKECFTMSRATGYALTNIKWQEACDKLKQESSLIWFIWGQCFKKTVSHYRNNNLIQSSFEELRIHFFITDWEKVMIEEEAEEGKRIESQILVPYQASVQIQNFLSLICKDLNKVIPHTVPKVVLSEISSSIVLELLDYYYNICMNINIHQKQAIQILFDVKYFTLLMVPRENKLLIEESNKVCNIVISKIDPFDFDVFGPFINTNVKRNVQRTLMIFGNLVSNMEQLYSILGARIEHNERVKPSKNPPGVIAICTAAPWFPPLTITEPIKPLPTFQIAVAERTHQRKKHPSKELTRNDSTGSTIKSGAAAFFGAMGSDWFGAN